MTGFPSTAMTDGPIEHLWTIACQNAQARPDGRLTLDGLVDNLCVSGLPGPGPVRLPYAV